MADGSDAAVDVGEWSSQNPRAASCSDGRPPVVAAFSPQMSVFIVSQLSEGQGGRFGRNEKSERMRTRLRDPANEIMGR